MLSEVPYLVILFIKDHPKLIAKLNDPTSKSKNWHIINKNCVELRYEALADYTIEADYISEITAVFTTANARMRLYAMLDWLDPSQVCYCDTDSVMFVYDKTNPLHKEPMNENTLLPKGLRFGKGLGEWEDEMDEGDWIEELVVGGAKSYTYRTHKGNIIVKQKGITLDRANETRVNFETMKNMVLNNETLQTIPRFTFAWENVSKDVITKMIARSVRSTIGEKRTIVGYDTVPYGYSL